MPADLVMAEQSEAELLLHELQGPDVAVDVAGELAGLGEQELRTGVALSDVPVHGGEDVRREIELVRLVVLARDELRLALLRPALHRLVHEELGRLPAEL